MAAAEATDEVNACAATRSDAGRQVAIEGELSAAGEVCITSTGDDSPEKQGVTKVASPTSQGLAAATPYG